MKAAGPSWKTSNEYCMRVKCCKYDTTHFSLVIQRSLKEFSHLIWSAAQPHPWADTAMPAVALGFGKNWFACTLHDLSIHAWHSTDWLISHCVIYRQSNLWWEYLGLSHHGTVTELLSIVHTVFLFSLYHPYLYFFLKSTFSTHCSLTNFLFKVNIQRSLKKIQNHISHSQLKKN